MAAVVAGKLEQHLADMRTVHLERDLRASREAEMRTAMESHAVIDQAMGTLIKARGRDAAAAWHVLQKMPQETNAKLRLLAEAAVELATGRGPAALDSDVEARLRRALGF